MKVKNSADCPMNRPMLVRNVSAPIAMPSLFVGRITEHLGRSWLMNGHGSGMIRFVWNSSPPNGAEFKSGNVIDTPVTGSTAVNGGAFPALSDQVWKCIVSVGPM